MDRVNTTLTPENAFAFALTKASWPSLTLALSQSPLPRCVLHGPTTHAARAVQHAARRPDAARTSSPSPNSCRRAATPL